MSLSDDKTSRSKMIEEFNKTAAQMTDNGLKLYMFENSDGSLTVISQEIYASPVDIPINDREAFLRAAENLDRSLESKQAQLNPNKK